MTEKLGPFQIPATTRQADKPARHASHSHTSSYASNSYTSEQIITTQTFECENNDTVLLDAPERRYECEHYEICLDVASALNWSNFTCKDCAGQVNPKILWRAKSASKQDAVAGKLCHLPEVGELLCKDKECKKKDFPVSED